MTDTHIGSADGNLNTVVDKTIVQKSQKLKENPFTDEVVKEMKYIELKRTAKKLQLSTSGTKAEIRRRLLAYVKGQKTREEDEDTDEETDEETDIDTDTETEDDKEVFAKLREQQRILAMQGGSVRRETYIFGDQRFTEWPSVGIIECSRKQVETWWGLLLLLGTISG
ncbi:hypothetical protein M0804_013595 [Polistes exclamans]|nr:hypothetical protein M0804_013595 [Polistes exclamans]